MRTVTKAAIIFSLLLLCCGNRDRVYSINLVFADQDFIQKISKVIVWVLPHELAQDCIRLEEKLQLGELNPNDYAVAQKVVLETPASDAKLTRVPPGDFIFLAEGRMANEFAIFRGCQSASVSPDVDLTVHIDMLHFVSTW